MYLELQMNEEAIDIYNFLKESGFATCSYLNAQIAIAYHNKRGAASFYYNFIPIFMNSP